METAFIQLVEMLQASVQRNAQLANEIKELQQGRQQQLEQTKQLLETHKNVLEQQQNEIQMLEQRLSAHNGMLQTQHAEQRRLESRDSVRERQMRLLHQNQRVLETQQAEFTRCLKEGQRLQQELRHHCDCTLAQHIQLYAFVAKKAEATAAATMAAATATTAVATATTAAATATIAEAGEQNCSSQERKEEEDPYFHVRKALASRPVVVLQRMRIKMERSENQ